MKTDLKPMLAVELSWRIWLVGDMFVNRLNYLSETHKCKQTEVKYLAVLLQGV